MEQAGADKLILVNGRLELDGPLAFTRGLLQRSQWERACAGRPTRQHHNLRLSLLDELGQAATMLIVKTTPELLIHAAGLGSCASQHANREPDPSTRRLTLDLFGPTCIAGGCSEADEERFSKTDNS